MNKKYVYIELQKNNGLVLKKYLIIELHFYVIFFEWLDSNVYFLKVHAFPSSYNKDFLLFVGHIQFVFPFCWSLNSKYTVHFTGHDIARILLKLALITNESIHPYYMSLSFVSFTFCLYILIFISLSVCYLCCFVLFLFLFEIVM